ncbi:MAG: nickel/cobalt transporter (NiCoT) family protein [Chloroflexota bacterium]|jgi:high-affinity nickel-transport protein|nr:nickel/cobalt transporter (NiCoT) family protein [Chloroflexota bacterium]
MASFTRTIQEGFDRGERARLGASYGVVALIHLLGWGALLTYGVGHPAFIGLGGLAYTFGLRHAFDADHISAIDNTTRKLLQQKQKPMTVGLFFSLGHSTVVFVIALALGLAVQSLVSGVLDDGGRLREVGGIIGTSVSGVFLLLIGILNLVILVDIVRIYGRMRRGEYDRTGLEQDLVAGGLLTRVFGRMFAVVTRSWHMYPIGFLFGLGFDTASEVALLAISAGAASQGVPFIAILSLPLIFAAAMSLMDTTDGAFMAKAYAWAFSNPIRKVFYNLTITGLSVFVALFVGVVELLQMLVQAANLSGGVWDAVGGLDFADMGFFIVGAFVVTWVAAFAIFKLRRIDERWAEMVRDHEHAEEPAA